MAPTKWPGGPGAITKLPRVTSTAHRPNHDGPTGIRPGRVGPEKSKTSNHLKEQPGLGGGDGGAAKRLRRLLNDVIRRHRRGGGGSDWVAR